MVSLFYSQNELIIILIGNTPSAVILSLIPLEDFDGDILKSSTNFERHDLETVDLTLDGISIPGYPISTLNNDISPFYHKYLYECNTLNNPYSSGLLTKSEMEKGMFLVVDNLKRKKIFFGQLAVRLKFTTALAKRLKLVVLTYRPKRIDFDEHLQVTVSQIDINIADRLNNQADAENK